MESSRPNKINNEINIWNHVRRTQSGMYREPDPVVEAGVGFLVSLTIALVDGHSLHPPVTSTYSMSDRISSDRDPIFSQSQPFFCVIHFTGPENSGHGFMSCLVHPPYGPSV